MEIEIYTKSNCIFCERAKQLLDSKNIAYEEYEVIPDSEPAHAYSVTRDQVLKLFPSAKTLPQISINGAAIGGFSELESFFD